VRKIIAMTAMVVTAVGLAACHKKDAGDLKGQDDRGQDDRGQDDRGQDDRAQDSR
jgi:hypothetical protein